MVEVEGDFDLDSFRFDLGMLRMFLQSEKVDEDVYLFNFVVV
jgi:hypothetical protein